MGFLKARPTCHVQRSKDRDTRRQSSETEPKVRHAAPPSAMQRPAPAVWLDGKLGSPAQWPASGSRATWCVQRVDWSTGALVAVNVRRALLDDRTTVVTTPPATRQRARRMLSGMSHPLQIGWRTRAICTSGCGVPRSNAPTSPRKLAHINASFQPTHNSLGMASSRPTVRTRQH